MCCHRSNPTKTYSVFGPGTYFEPSRRYIPPHGYAENRRPWAQKLPQTAHESCGLGNTRGSTGKRSTATPWPIRFNCPRIIRNDCSNSHLSFFRTFSLDTVSSCSIRRSCSVLSASSRARLFSSCIVLSFAAFSSTWRAFSLDFSISSRARIFSSFIILSLAAFRFSWCALSASISAVARLFSSCIVLSFAACSSSLCASSASF